MRLQKHSLRPLSEEPFPRVASASCAAAATCLYFWIRPMVRACVAAIALAVAADALQLPGACRSSVSAARRGPVGMALADGVLNVGETRCECDAHAMPRGVCL